MKTLTKNWTITRGIHFVMSVVVLYYAFELSNIFLGILGGGFFFQSILSVGCSTGNCSTRR
ncbi:hypothetical protein [Emticicia oligotrophica]|uniref:hypothetical protein n=1 Tax=Emticicia oligotrophica TaxID=312279 RepID=UPI00273C3012|nr:hypothetical protein [Emticicia oligotrophica]